MKQLLHVAAMYAWRGVWQGLSIHMWNRAANRTTVLEQMHWQICTDSSRRCCRRFKQLISGEHKNHMNSEEPVLGHRQKISH